MLARDVGALVTAAVLLAGCSTAETAPAGTPDSTAPPACTAASYRLVAVAEGATGSALLGVEVHPTSQRPCRLRTQAAFLLRDGATGSPLPLPHNPLGVALSLDLPDGTARGVVWAEPYCPPGDVDLVVRDGLAHTSTAHGVVHPRCDPAAGQTGRGPGLAVVR